MRSTLPSYVLMRNLVMVPPSQGRQQVRDYTSTTGKCFKLVIHAPFLVIGYIRGLETKMPNGLKY